MRLFYKKFYFSYGICYDKRMENNKTNMSQERIADIKFSESLRLLENNQLFYYEILRRINFVIDPRFKKAIGGIGYDPKGKKIYYFLDQDAVIKNSYFNEKGILINPENSLKDLAGLTEHECGHLLYDHIFYVDKSKDEKLDNMAKDYIINDSGSFLGLRYDEIKDPKNNSILANGCFFRELSELIPELKGKTANDFTSNQIYEILQSNKDKLPKSPSRFDEHSVLKVSVDENGDLQIESGEGMQLTEEESQNLSSEVKKVLSNTIQDLKDKGKLGKAIGQMKGDLADKITEMMKSKTDREVAFNFTHSLKNGRKASWTRLNKRYPYLAKGRVKDKKPILVRGIDTSGSMNNDELRQMIAYQVYQLVDICKELHIVVGDTEMQFAIHITDPSQFDIETISFSGGGGTILQFIWDYAEEVGADGVICDTDGYIGSIDDKGIPSLFYLYGQDHKEIEGYENYRVFPE